MECSSSYTIDMPIGGLLLSPCQVVTIPSPTKHDLPGRYQCEIQSVQGRLQELHDRYAIAYISLPVEYSLSFNYKHDLPERYRSKTRSVQTRWQELHNRYTNGLYFPTYRIFTVLQP